MTFSMTNKRTERVTRRTVLGATGALAVGATALGVSADSTPGDGLVLEQGGDCVPITPISGGQSAERMYEWDVHETDYSSAGTRDLQRGDTSILFLYEDPAGDYYLVVVHDRYDLDDRGSRYDGGSATFEVSGLAGGSWVVRDDDYDSPSSYDNWNVSQEPQVIDWTWGDARTDGGVYGPLEDGFEVTIDPAFNEGAGLYGEYYDGRITDWEVLSGARSNPDRTSLSLDQPITIRTGQCEPSRPPAPGQLDVRIPQGKVNPRSRGVLAVDLHSTQSHPVTELDTGSIRTAGNGVSPSQVALRPGNRDVVRLFFRIPELDLSGGSTATVGIKARTTDGTSGTGSATVELINSPGDDDGDDDRGRDDDDDDNEEEEDDDRGRDDGDDENEEGEDDDDEEEEKEDDEEEEEDDEEEEEEEEDDEEEEEEEEDDEEEEEDEDDDEEEDDEDEDDDDDEDDRGRVPSEGPPGRGDDGERGPPGNGPGGR